MGVMVAVTLLKVQETGVFDTKLQFNTMCDAFTKFSVIEMNMFNFVWLSGVLKFNDIGCPKSCGEKMVWLNATESTKWNEHKHTWLTKTFIQLCICVLNNIPGKCTIV